MFSFRFRESGILCDANKRDRSYCIAVLPTVLRRHRRQLGFSHKMASCVFIAHQIQNSQTEILAKVTKKKKKRKKKIYAISDAFAMR